VSENRKMLNWERKFRKEEEVVFVKAWKILVQHCGARPSGQDDFVFRICRSVSDRRMEYRFGGNLGFGGKFYVNLERDGFIFYASYCKEDETPERVKAIKKANEAFLPIMDEYNILVKKQAEIWQKQQARKGAGSLERE
jgi:hypothetical protein